jgi:hypothetical protein
MSQTVFETKIPDVPAYLQKHEETQGNVTVDLVRKVVAYLHKFKVKPNHYSIIQINGEDRYLLIQIDQQCGYVDRQVSKSKFSFINGTCFSIDFDDIN